MKMFTLRLKPKTIFGLILIATGVVVIAVTFFANHVAGDRPASGSVTLATDEERAEYLTSLGWRFSSSFEEKQIRIPMEFNETYSQYNEIQKSQGFDLEPYKGETVTVYTYNILNYQGYENEDYILANLIVLNGELIGGDICSTSAENGFMQGLKK